MRLFTLDARLGAIAGLVPPGALLYDVGTDHARLPVYLLCTGRIAAAVASDIRQGPLAAARKTAERFGVAERMRFELCDGVPPQAERDAGCVVIAGMGGENIAGILDRAKWLERSRALVIMQPMTRREVLENYLEGRYDIESVQLVRCSGGRQREYVIIAARGRGDEAEVL